MFDAKMMVAINLKKYRTEAGMTQKDLAGILGVKHNAVSSWESGVNSIDIEVLFKICEALRVDINLMLGKPNGNNKPDSIIRKCNQLNEQGKMILEGYLDGLLSNDSLKNKSDKKLTG